MGSPLTIRTKFFEHSVAYWQCHVRETDKNRLIHQPNGLGGYMTAVSESTHAEASLDSTKWRTLLPDPLPVEAFGLGNYARDSLLAGNIKRNVDSN